MKNFSIGKELVEILNTNDVYKVKDKIFPLVAVANTTFPFVVYRRIGYTPQSNKDYTNEQVSIEMNVASETYKEGQDIANSIADILTVQETDIIDEINLSNVSETYLEDTFIQNLQFTITLK